MMTVDNIIKHYMEYWGGLDFTTMKLPLATENQNWPNILG